ncbi:amine oxidase [Imleria badia]|nr:amine oxidase [Imleria badia]
MHFEDDLLAFYGRNIIQDYHNHLRAKLSLKAGQSDSFDVFDDELRFLPEKKVGILGAGIGGLYVALILDSLDLKYKILEASDRSGGQMCTYNFPGEGRNNYYDAGAMRFPFPKKDTQGRYKNGIMKRLAELAEYTLLNQGRDRLKDSLIPFYPQAWDSSKPGFYYYNGIREPVSNAAKGPFGAQEMDVDTDYIRAGVDAIMSDVTQLFAQILVQDIETGKTKGWEILRANDLHTGRSYMATKYLPSVHLELPPEHLPNNIISWCGLLGGGCEGALVETVFYSLAFTRIGDTDYGDVEWKCFEGGSETLPKKIEEYLNKKGRFIQFDKRVAALSQADPLGDWTHNYSHVISTLPLSVLRTVNLSRAGLNVMQKNALRSLGYGALTKIAILFKSNWWTTKLGIMGGQTFTDLPICSIVYPSHGVDSGTPSKVLVASYSWKSDANTLGSLATLKSREVLLDLVLRNLAEIHKGLHPDVTYAYLKEEVVDMHVKDWGCEEYALGAYAYFGPGQFQDLYASLTYPAASKHLHFAGEAVSTHHSWVVGALDSSWRAVYEYLKVMEQAEKIRKFKTLWGESSKWASQSAMGESAKENNGRDLLDEHLGLVDRAIRDRIIRQCH